MAVYSEVRTRRMPRRKQLQALPSLGWEWRNLLPPAQGGSSCEDGRAHPRQLPCWARARSTRGYYNLHFVHRVPLLGST